jgi:hypothetical protein
MGSRYPTYFSRDDNRTTLRTTVWMNMRRARLSFTSNYAALHSHRNQKSSSNTKNT